MDVMNVDIFYLYSLSMMYYLRVSNSPSSLWLINTYLIHIGVLIQDEPIVSDAERLFIIQSNVKRCSSSPCFP